MTGPAATPDGGGAEVGAVGPNSPSWATYLAGSGGQPTSERRAELLRLATETRRLLHGMSMTDAPTDQLRAAADALAAVADLFEHPDRRSVHEGFGEASVAGDPHAFFDHSPVLGAANPVAPPLRLRSVEGDTARATVTFDAGYEGPPGCVHGGFVAAAFDEVLGITQSLSGQPGMTVALSIQYRSPTPLHEELTLTGTFERTEGRKTFTSGTLHHGDVLCAEATGLFVSIDFAQMAAMRTAREAGERARTRHRPDDRSR